MAKFIKIACLDNEDKADDYQMYIRPQLVIRVDTASAVDRKRRSEVNSVVITTTGSVRSTENAATLVNRLAEEELVGS